MKRIDTWKSLLRVRLKEALAARQQPVVSVLRETLAALDNAEAPAAGAAPIDSDGAFAGSLAGLGAGEVARLSLGPEAVAALIAREIRERRDAAQEYRRLGRDEAASLLELQADVLARLEAEPG